MASNIFNTVLLNKPKRNMFDMSYDRKMSLDMGKLVPCHVQEVIPGDKINIQTQQLIRMAPLVAPVMHKINVYTHFFFVPNRLLWSEWEDFITGGENGMANPQFPTISLDTNAPSTIADYLGIPTFDTLDEPLTCSALPHAAYGLIYNEYYRDQNLQSPLDLALSQGDNTTLIEDAGLLGGCLNRAWEHDYFTSALPWPQKGPEVTLPLGDTAPLQFVEGLDATATKLRDVVSGGTIGSTNLSSLDTDGTGRMIYATDEAGFDVTGHTEVDLSTATASSINDLRRAFKLQEWLERNARGGTRYIEQILSHFGVQSSDARLQRPEYLGGGKSNVSISEVLQTSESVNTPQGNLAGHGINVGTSHSFSRSFEEHGYIIGIMSVMPEPAYSQGLPKHFHKFDKFDFFWPAFANIGEQEIKYRELYVDIPEGTRDSVFGYTPRYAEYRFNNSSVHGDFRNSLEYWHLGRKFNTMPVLNSAFIKCDPSDRIFAVQNLPDDGSGDTPVRDVDQLYCHVFHKITAVRPLPKFGVPQF